jgi:hypothetical protein
MWIHFFPAKGGISNTLSPQAIVTGLSPNADKYCRITFGSYAQVHADNSQHSNNAMISQTVGAISLGPTGNIQGTYKLMSLLTGKIIKARSFTPLPMPEDVVKQVERMGAFNYSSENENTPLNPVAAYEGYQPPDEEDDISLASSNYSKISQSELNDIRVENQKDTKVDDDSFIPETVVSEMCIPIDAPAERSDEGQQIQGVDEDNNNNQPHDTTHNFKEDGIPDDLKEVNYDDNLEYNKSEEEEDMSECAENNESSRTHYVTKRGRDIKLRRDLFDNYDFFKTMQQMPQLPIKKRIYLHNGH